jgi:hypothetical protein
VLAPPTIEARIVAMARHFTALVADPDHEMGADEAIATIRRIARDDADETAARLLICALGIFPTGTLVELDGGTIAQVARVSPDIRKFAFPVVRPIVDASGGTRGGLVDLAMDRARRIVRLVSLGDPPAPAEAETSPYDDFDALEHAGSADLDDLEHAGSDEPVPPRAVSHAAPRSVDEEDDDVPSMVLQAIVDGRRGEADDENTAVFETKKPALGALFLAPPPRRPRHPVHRRARTTTPSHGPPPPPTPRVPLPRRTSTNPPAPHQDAVWYPKGRRCEASHGERRRWGYGRGERCEGDPTTCQPRAWSHASPPRRRPSLACAPRPPSSRNEARPRPPRATPSRR